MVNGMDAGTLGAQVKTASEKTVMASVSLAQGGDNNGPNPHELLESSLAACTVITVKMYAQRKSWPLLKTHVTVRIASEGTETKINRTLRFEGTLDQEQKDRLADIANKCPVHKILSHSISIETQVEN